ncbi:HUWE1-associated protein modifying stress responses-like [Paramacrobiotus metropolitanus]|uniref:HUWE1-associated protein modifying stress responses-like n=1 Tax=Paramacrobiotus metropolitanus TaxID=2943436 RepID=UPI0024460ED7|nr:HUWE1-associated protein modifying stress responses-like [Paramacrobiotus metropolitanus]
MDFGDNERSSPQSNHHHLLALPDDDEDDGTSADPSFSFSMAPLTSVPTETEPRPSRTVSGSQDLYAQNAHTWILFQDAAASTSKLYQARSSGQDGHWHNFQNAARSISLLYKESLDLQQRSYDSGYRAGVEKAYGAVMEWLVQDPRYHSRKNIRTDDLINFIYSPKNPAALNIKLRPTKAMERSLAGNDAHLTTDHQLGDLQTFQDALHVSSLNVAMSHFSVNRSPPRSSPPRGRPVDLHAFVTEEIRRHKRSSGSAFDLDDDEDSLPPAAFKRSRYTPPK